MNGRGAWRARRLLFVGGLVTLFAVALSPQSGSAVSIKEAREDIEKLQKKQVELSERIRDLSAMLDEMTDDETAIKDREGYAKSLIYVYDELEKVRARLKEAKETLKEVRFDARLKLIEISGEGTPGMYKREESKSIGGAEVKITRKELVSLKVVRFPLEVDPTKPFSFLVEVKNRIAYPEAGSCFTPSSGYDPLLDPRFRTGFSFDTTDVPGETRSPAKYYSEGTFNDSRLCADAPSRKHGNIEWQAPYEKEGAVTVAFHFLPAKSEWKSLNYDHAAYNGDYKLYYYKIETDSHGNGETRYDVRVDDSAGAALQAPPAMFQISNLSDGDHSRNCCPSHGNCHTCFYTGFTVSFELPSLDNPLTFTYRDIPEGEPYISSAPVYNHPGEFEEPLTVGELKFDVEMPDLIGKTHEAALDILEKAGLSYKLLAAGAPEERWQEERVAKQEPAPGTVISLGADEEGDEKAKVWFYSAYVEPRVTVPNLVGLTYADAKEALKQAELGMKPRAAGDPPGEEQASKVKSQNPLAGESVVKGMEVDIWVYSASVPKVAVPDVGNMPYTAAREKIRETELEVVPKPAGDPPSEEKAEKVSRQDPAPGAMIKKGEKVTLWVYSGYTVPQVTVPDLANRSSREARSLLSQAELVFEQADAGRAPDRSLEGRVQKQSPAAYATVKKGSTVKVWVYGSAPPPPQPIYARVPEVRWKHYSEAEQLMRAAGLGVTWRKGGRAPTKGQLNTISAQNPQAGSQVPPGTTVTLTYYDSYQPTPDELVAQLDCSMYGMSYAIWSARNNRAECACMDGYEWDRYGNCAKKRTAKPITPQECEEMKELARKLQSYNPSIRLENTPGGALWRAADCTRITGGDINSPGAGGDDDDGGYREDTWICNCTDENGRRYAEGFGQACGTMHELYRHYDCVEE